MKNKDFIQTPSVLETLNERPSCFPSHIYYLCRGVAATTAGYKGDSKMLIEVLVLT